VGIPTSQNPDTPEGLKSWLSIRIRRIPVDLPHSNKLVLGKLHQTQTDFGRASALELLQGLPTSRDVLRPSEPHLSLYSTKNELESTIEVKPYFLHTFC
jgi:hypothetical protein